MATLKAKKSLGAILEQMELVAVDTKKEFYYNKGTGLWSWLNRGENAEDGNRAFATRLAALVDATEPYMNG